MAPTAIPRDNGKVTVSSLEAPFLSRVRLKNYKSVAACDVRLGRLMFLVGPNGAGKSNFLDALRLVTDALNTTLDHALRDRGGIGDVRRRSGGHPTHFGIRLDFVLPSGGTGHFAFRVSAQRGGGFEVQTEECAVQVGPLAPAVSYRVDSGEVTTNGIDVRLPGASGDRLYLTTASAIWEFREVFDALLGMGFYNINPNSIRDLQAPDSGGLLRREGGNVASVLGHMATTEPAALARVEEYLSKVVPGVTGVERIALGPRETVQFRQQVAGADRPWRFQAASMSDGTLRALGVLIALLQPRLTRTGRATLIGIEEPEVALHPAAAGVLLDALQEASDHVQVLVTSHSPDLLDNPDIPVEQLLAVTADAGTTVVGRVTDSTRVLLLDRLFTAGELMRQDQLRPDAASQALVKRNQLELFGE